MLKLSLVPQQAQYSVDAEEAAILRVQLDGGAGRYRRDLLGATQVVNVTWALDPGEYHYIQAFYRAVGRGATPFLVDLILEGQELDEYTVNFLPGTFRLAGVSGLRYQVSASLEVRPSEGIDDEDYNTALVDLFDAFGPTAYNADGPAALLFSELETASNVEFPEHLHINLRWPLTFSFLGSPINADISFTRASEGSYIDSAGVLHWFAAGEPRIGDRGLLIEKGATNVSLYSEQFDNSAHIKSNTTIEADATEAPDGTMTGDKLVEDATTGAFQIWQSHSYTNGTTYAFSVFVKPAGREYIIMGFNTAAFPNGADARFHLSGEGEVLATGPGAESAGIEKVGDWYRCWVAATADATASHVASIRLMNSPEGLSYTGDGESGVYIWGAQLEAGAYPTSYIRTEGSAVARATDMASLDLSSADWFNADEGTIVAEFMREHDSPSSIFPGIVFFGTDVSNRLSLINRTLDDTTRLASVVGGVGQAEATAGPAYTYGSVRRVAARFAEDDFAISVDGSNVNKDTSGDLPSMTAMHLGVISPANNFLDGFIRSLVYYPRTLDDDELQAMTS